MSITITIYYYYYYIIITRKVPLKFIPQRAPPTRKPVNTRQLDKPDSAPPPGGFKTVYVAQPDEEKEKEKSQKEKPEKEKPDKALKKIATPRVRAKSGSFINNGKGALSPRKMIVSSFPELVGGQVLIARLRHFS